MSCVSIFPNLSLISSCDILPPKAGSVFEERLNDGAPVVVIEVSKDEKNNRLMVRYCDGRNLKVALPKAKAIFTVPLREFLHRYSYTNTKGTEDRQ